MRFNLKHFAIIFLIIIVVFFIFDIVVDALAGKLDMEHVFSTRNILIKTAAGLVAGLIFAISGKKDKANKP